jgi:hypothetical protein
MSIIKTDGWIEQSIYIATGNSNPYVWNFKVPFSDTNFFVSSTPKGSGIGYLVSYPDNADFSATSIKVTRASEGGMTPISQYAFAYGY